MLRIFLTIFSGTALGAAILMVRNLMIARMLSPADYGIASTFAVAMAVVAMLSELGSSQYIIHSRDGNSREFHAASNGFSILRGIVGSIILFFTADLVASFFGHPELAWAYQIIAVSPLLLGFFHGDVFRMRRQMRFRSSFFINTLPHLISTLAVWPLYQFLPDFRLMIGVALVQAATMLLSSFAIAERRYELRFSATFIRGLLRFGWPILLNGALLFLVFNGERLVVGNALTMEDLAILSLGLSLTLTPILAVSNSLGLFFLPQLTALKDDRAAFLGVASVTFQTYYTFSAASILGITLLSGPFLHGVLGGKYDEAVVLMPLLAVMQGIRMAKEASSTVGLAQGMTINGLLGNLPRVLMLPLAWLAVKQGGSFEVVIWLGILGEAIGFVLALGIALWKLKLVTTVLVKPLFLLITLMGVALSPNLGRYGEGEWLPNVTGAVIMLGIFIQIVITCRDMSAYISHREVHRYDE